MSEPIGLIALQEARKAGEMAEQILDDSFDLGALNTNIEQRLNDLEVQYEPRLTGIDNKVDEVDGRLDTKIDDGLNSVNQQLAQTATDIDQRGLNVNTLDSATDTQAITDALSLSDVIFIPRRDTPYLLSSTVVLDGKKIESNGAKIKHQSLTNFPLFKLLSNCEISGLDFESDGVLYNTNGDLIDSKYSLIRVEGNRNKVHDNTFSEISDCGVYLKNSNYNDVVDNTIINENPLEGGIRGRFGIGLAKGKHNNISRNNIKNVSCGISSLSNSDFTEFSFLTENQYNIFDNNVIETCTEHGMYISSGSFESIRNNVVRDVYNSGLKIRSSNSIVSNNNVDSSGLLNGGNTAGISIASPASYTSAVGNTVKSKKLGSDIDGANLETIKTAQGFSAAYEMKFNKITSNTIQCVEPSNTLDRVGIRVSSLGTERARFKNHEITGNQITGFNTGIWAFEFTELRISDNAITGEGTYLSGVYGNGIIVDKAHVSLYILNNFIKDFPSKGIYINFTNTSGLVMKSNIIRGNEGNAIEVTATSGLTNAVFFDNWLFGNGTNKIVGNSTVLSRSRTTLEGTVFQDFKTGSGTPNVAPEFVGQIYINTSATPREVYIGTNILTVADFVKLT